VEGDTRKIASYAPTITSPPDMATAAGRDIPAAVPVPSEVALAPEPARVDTEPVDSPAASAVAGIAGSTTASDAIRARRTGDAASRRRPETHRRMPWRALLQRA
jgi:hypothetical protein